ncbi:hypothetical protein FHR75_003401 [Kineococcus radiotolerans]|uniref:EVE domain-containing protein n=2 Tax=Kineococcus radiotolerans TaxID=131568 RepID=A6WFU8_KINRD|nr:hypothetical protein [Kineococcus radiotolerans]ABS05687.1 conserved hypothetical protein [Kineococcus radiotolerans SRS30216 = ATCC BAA-149]MBB2902570.1 hypothetical protein [Kineococcus radiotolerans]
MQRLSGEDVACWLLKSAGWPAELTAGGGVQRLHRCLRRSYRLDLVSPGQPCLLWVSGRVRPGVAAVGRVVGHPGADDRVEVELLPLAVPVARAELLGDGRFRDAEVVRMAAGSNPSYLRADQLAAVRERLDDAALAAWGAVAGSPSR